MRKSRFATVWAGLSLGMAAWLAGGFAVPSLADEGMWTFDNLPLQTLKERYGFEPPAGWADHLRLSAVRFNNGGSGSFVSANGLIMTNHHVGADVLQKISTPERNIYESGFLAETPEQEIAAPDLEINVLVGIKDVTNEVNAAVQPDMDDARAAQARRAAMATLEKKSLEETGLRSDVVTLYQGGRYALYTYKKYTDVRLVFAPEFNIAFFGGDPDNFEYPRYCLDVCFFRAYENGQPAKVEHHLAWSRNGSQDGELVFVAGHPGRTSRQFTVAHLEYLRDHAFPLLLSVLAQREADLKEYSQRGEEQARQAKEDLFGIQNSIKARTGGLKGLQDQALMARKAQEEKALRDAVANDPNLKDYATAWDKIAEAQKVARRVQIDYSLLERGFAFDSQLFNIARGLVRLAEETAKPNEDRLREYRDSNLDSLKLGLFSPAPIYPEFEEFKLARSLRYWYDQVGPNNDLIQQALRGERPEAAAKRLVDGTKLADVAYRKELAEGGRAAIESCVDPMIVLARLVDPAAREVRKIREDQVEGVETANYALIAKARFAQLGDSVYPDATFTLRLAIGTVAGYEVDGQTIPPYTTYEGLFQRADLKGNQPPYVVPSSWIKARDEKRIDLNTPFNFVSTNDIIGGNSGSPVVNRNNEVVGLIFDGNIQSLVLDFVYDDKVARAVSVDSRGILQALKHVYHAANLVRELTGE